MTKDSFPTSLIENGLLVLEKIFEAFPYILLCISLSVSAWCMVIH